MWLLCVALALCAAKTRWNDLERTKYDFAAYKKEFGRSYVAGEEPKRKALFESRLAEIMRHNRDSSNGWKKGVNHFTDRTDAELKAMRGVKRSMLYSESPVVKTTAPSSMPLRHSVDWRDENVISTVKDQGQCGSCWSFSAVESVESYWALATGELAVLSEQQVLDCTTNVHCGGTGGCSGATISLAMQTMISMGASSEFTYPYVSYWGSNQTCAAGTQKAQPFARVAQHVHLPSNQQAPMLQHLSQVGPLSGVVDAGEWSSYETGVFHGCGVNATVDHGIQIVGFGHDDDVNMDFWLIRNSWSASFGENGYIRILRTPHASCGWDNNPLEGSGCVGGPSRVAVCGECAVLYSPSYPIVKQ